MTLAMIISMQQHSTSVNARKRVLMLATDAHGGFGGIAQYNRDILEALATLGSIGEVVVLPRIVNDCGFLKPPQVHYDLRSAGSRPAFIRRSAVHSANGGHFDFVYCAHINLMPIAAFIGRMRRIPVVLAIYGIDAWCSPSSWLAARLARSCQHVFSISQITLDRFRSWAGAGQVTTAVLPNAIRAEDYGLGPRCADLVARHNLAQRKVVMTFGRMSSKERYKGFDEVIEVLPRLRAVVPEITYLMAGDGPDRPRLAAKVRELGVEGIVVFAGHIPEERKADYYRLADAYVMPSNGEGFGFVVLEALACGIPVIASTNDGTREALKGGELGRLIDPADAAALARAILEAIVKPKAIPAGLEHFSLENFTRRLDSAVNRVFSV